MNKFTEREAIQQEMEFIKEQSRQDFQLYFEMRKQRNQRYDELLNRLRELDDKEELKTHQIEFELTPMQQPRKERFADLTPEQRVVDRYKEETEPKLSRTQEAERTCKLISDYVMTQRRQVSRTEIKNYLAQEHGKDYANISDILKRAEELDVHLIKEKYGKRTYYTYAVQRDRD